jgi:hypothetical protein
MEALFASFQPFTVTVFLDSPTRSPETAPTIFTTGSLPSEQSPEPMYPRSIP